MSEIKNPEIDKLSKFKNIWLKVKGKKIVINPKLGFPALSLISFLVFALVLLTPDDSIHFEARFDIPAVGSEVKLTNIPDKDSLPKNSGNNSSSSASARTKVFKGPELVLRNQSDKILPGTFVKARLVTGASNGLVKAVLTQDVRTFQGETLYQKGTVLIGMGVSSYERLQVRFNQLISTEGQIVSIEGQACELDDQSVGLRGSMVGNKATKVGLGIGLSFVGGMSVGLQDRTQSGGQSPFSVAQDAPKPSLKNALLNGAATAALDESKELMTEARNQAPIIHVPAGKEIFILFTNP
ncbi:MAG: TrbI/VirB10 family protein [Xanthomonadaceae bacterium]|nr:TrbI/VirB10 family protein [Xanthomonadaceae bacterium]